MLAPIKEFTSTSFDETYIANYRLELLLAEDGLLMAVRNQLGHPLYFAAYENPGELPPYLLLAQLSTSQPRLQPKYDSVHLLSCADPWFFAPQSQLTRGKEANLFEVLFESNTAKNRVIRFDVDALKLTTLHLLGQEEEQTCRDALPQFRKVAHAHVASAILDVAARVYVALSQKPIASVVLLDNSFFYIVFDAQKLLFCNRFYCASEADVLYYVMSVNEKLQLDTASLITYVSGYAKHREDTVSLMRTQFTHFLPGEKIFPTNVEMSDAGITVDEYSFMLAR